jgi:arsenate reductase
MAEVYLNHFYGDRYKAYSAGTHPTNINPNVVKVMAEDGFDLREAKSKSIEEFLDWDFDLVITVCDDARETCPIFPSGELIHQSFKDPSSIVGSENKLLEQVGEIRDEIKNWVKTYFKRSF